MVCTLAEVNRRYVHSSPIGAVNFEPAGMFLNTRGCVCPPSTERRSAVIVTGPPGADSKLKIRPCPNAAGAAGPTICVRTSLDMALFPVDHNQRDRGGDRPHDARHRLI